MQKDEIVSEFSSVEFDETKSNKAIKVKDIQKTEIIIIKIRKDIYYE